MSVDDVAFSLTVEPQPTADEADALTAALAVYLAQRRHDPVIAAEPSTWSMAGRIAAHTLRSGWNYSIPRTGGPRQHSRKMHGHPERNGALAK